MSFLQTKSQFFRIKNKSELLQYLPNQQSADNRLSYILNEIRQFNSAFQLGWQTKLEQIIDKINNSILKMDNQHRSYWKVRSIIMGSNIMLMLQLGEMQRVHEMIIQEEMIVSYIGRPQYTAKMYLLKIVTLLHLSAEGEDQNAFIKKSVKYNYDKFCKIRFQTQTLSVQLRFWEHMQLLELLIYQYLLILHKMSDKNVKKATSLYKRGLSIAKQLLGKNHKLVNMMQKIIQMRKNTNKLLKDSRPKSTFVLSGKSKSKKIKFKMLKTQSQVYANSNRMMSSQGMNLSVDKNFILLNKQKIKDKSKNSIIAKDSSFTSQNKLSHSIFKQQQNPQAKQHNRIKQKTMKANTESSQQKDTKGSKKKQKDLYIPAINNKNNSFESLSNSSSNKLGGKIVRQDKKKKQSQKNLQKLVQIKTKGIQNQSQIKNENENQKKLLLTRSTKISEIGNQKSKVQAGEQVCCQLI